jgi:hypothetical protein
LSNARLPFRLIVICIQRAQKPGTPFSMISQRSHLIGSGSGPSLASCAWICTADVGTGPLEPLAERRDSRWLVPEGQLLASFSNLTFFIYTGAVPCEVSFAAPLPYFLLHLWFKFEASTHHTTSQSHRAASLTCIKQHYCPAFHCTSSPRRNIWML